MYPYNGPENMDIAHIASINGAAVEVWGKTPTETEVLTITDKTIFCKSDSSGRTRRVSDWSYLQSKIDSKEFVTFKYTKKAGRVAKVLVVWDFVPPGTPYEYTFRPADGTRPTTKRMLHYEFPRVCK
jgi:hypothetical protein